MTFLLATILNLFAFQPNLAESPTVLMYEIHVAVGIGYQQSNSQSLIDNSEPHNKTLYAGSYEAAAPIFPWVVRLAVRNIFSRAARGMLRKSTSRATVRSQGRRAIANTRHIRKSKRLSAANAKTLDDAERLIELGIEILDDASEFNQHISASLETLVANHGYTYEDLDRDLAQLELYLTRIEREEELIWRTQERLNEAALRRLINTGALKPGHVAASFRATGDRVDLDAAGLFYTRLISRGIPLSAGFFRAGFTDSKFFDEMLAGDGFVLSHAVSMPENTIVLIGELDHQFRRGLYNRTICELTFSYSMLDKNGVSIARRTIMAGAPARNRTSALQYAIDALVEQYGNALASEMNLAN